VTSWTGACRWRHDTPQPSPVASRAMSTPVPPAGGAPVSVRPCPVCGTPVAADALFCPNCGTPFQRGRGPDAALVAAGVLAVIVGILLALLLTQGDSGTTPATPTTTQATITTTPAPTAPGTPVPTTTAPVPTPGTTSTTTTTTPPATTTAPSPPTSGPVPTTTAPGTPAPTTPTTTTAPGG
jgi:predicted nucleic acid-binding Zn ribbon protein